MNNNPKTVSFEEVQAFVENDLKVGELYKVVSRKWSDWDFLPCLLDLNKLIYIEKKDINVVIFCLDKMPLIPVGSPAPARRRSCPPFPTSATQEQRDLWCKNMFIKVFFQDKICLVHAGWLEKL